MNMLAMLRAAAPHLSSPRWPALLATLLFSSSLALAGEGAPIGPIDRARIHLAKGGSGWIELHGAYFGDSDHALKLDPLAEYGATERKTQIVTSTKGRKQYACHGRFADVFQLVRILDSSQPFLLYRNKEFDVSWKQELLKVRLKIKDDKPATKSPGSPVVEITTDGRITKSSSGEISPDRRKVVFTPETEIAIEFEDLGLD